MSQSGKLSPHRERIDPFEKAEHESEPRRRGSALDHWPFLAALLVVALAFFVRVIDLGRQSFWWDEAYSTLLVERGLRAVFQELREFDFHPPLHYVLTWGWIKIAGRSEFALRFLALSFGVLSVSVASSLGARLFGRRGRFTVGLVFALSPFLYYYSQEARMYAPTMLFTTLALYLFWRAFELSVGNTRTEDGGRLETRLWLAYALTTALGLYTFYYFVFVPIFCGVWGVGYHLFHLHAKRRHSFVRLIGFSLLAAALYLPWLPVLFGRNAVWDSQWAQTSSPVKVFLWSFTTLTLGLADPKLLDQTVPLVFVLILGAILFFGLVRAFWSRSAVSAGFFFVLLAFALPLALMAAVALVKPVFHPRYALPAAPGLLLALGGALTLVPARLPAKRVAYWVGLVALIAAFGYGHHRLTTDPDYFRDDYRGAVGHIVQAMSPTDTIIYNAHPGFRYYYDGVYHGQAPATFFPGAPYEEESIAQSLNALAQGKTRLWYLRHSESPTDPEGIVERQLESGATKLEEGWYGDLRLTLYALPEAPSFSSATFTPTDALFGGKLRLVGYALGKGDDPVPAGGKTDLRLRWKVESPLEDYGIWVGLADEASQSWGRSDRQPRDSQMQLSGRWAEGEVVTTHHDLAALVGTPPGGYRLEVGVYKLANKRGLDLLDAQGRPFGQSFTPGSVVVALPESFALFDPALKNRGSVKVAPSVELVGWSLDPDTKVASGGSVGVTLLWRATARPESDYRGVLDLVSAEGVLLRQINGFELARAHPTASWREGELVRTHVQLSVPPNAKGGKASLRVGLVGQGAGIEIASVTIESVERSYVVPTVEKPVGGEFEGVGRLLGFRTDRQTLRPGDSMKVTLYWQATADGQKSYRVFTHLLDPAGIVRGQKDSEPRDWTRPTSGWLKGEVIEDSYTLDLAANAPQGAYELEIGLYDPLTQERLLVLGPSGEERGDRLVLETLDVLP